MSKKKYNKSLDELLLFMYNGGKVIHEDWSEGEWITIKDGEFMTETGKEFTLSPWMIESLNFGIYEDLKPNRENKSRRI
jgi:hypothetical protein